MLASEAAIAHSGLPPDVDNEIAAFVAALLPEDRRNDIVALLASRDIFTLARALRLRPPGERLETLAVDARRYADTMQLLAPLNGERLEHGCSFLAAGDESWLAARPKKGADVEVADQPFDEWSAVGDGEQTLVVWPVTPFSRQIPEFVAAGETLYSFKRRVDRALKEPEPRWHRDDAVVEQLLLDERLLTARVIDFFGRWRDAINERASELGLSDSPALPLPSGDPQLTVYRHGHNGNPLIHVKWATGESLAVSDDGEPEFPAYDLGLITRDPDAEGRNWLRQRVEEALGSPLDSASWSRPELLAAWVW